MAKKQKEQTTEEITEEVIDPINPAAIYDDHSAHDATESFWDRMRGFSHKNKRVLYAALLVTFIGSVILNIITISRPTMSNILLSDYARKTAQPENPIYSIENYFFGSSDLVLRYMALSEYTWGPAGAKKFQQNKKHYTDYLVDQFETDLLVVDGLKKEVFNTPQATVILMNALKHAAAEYYVQTMLKQKDSDFSVTVTESDIENFYKKNKHLFSDMNVPESEMKGIIQNSLLQSKQQETRIDFFLKRKKILEKIQKEEHHKFY